MTDHPTSEQSATPEWDWKHTIIVFGRGDIPSTDGLVAAERAAVAVLEGDRSVGRLGLASDGVYEPPSDYVDECVHCGRPAAAHEHAHMACPKVTA